MARSTYYYHAARLDAPDKYAELKDEITELFYRHKRRFGHRRIRLLLRRGGWVVSKKLVFKLMDQLGLKSKVRTKRKYTSYQGTISHIADNHLGRKFSAAAPNRKWVSDVTEFRIAGSKVYLSPVYDLFDHCVVSHTLGLSPFTALTATSLNNALSAHNPGHGIMVHTDQGFQYQHTSWHRLLEDHEAAASMSRKGNCYDNAVMENFFGHLKAEMYHGEHFSTVEDFTAAVDEYIEWYNTERVQERLEGMTPMEYRNHALLVTRPA